MSRSATVVACLAVVAVALVVGGPEAARGEEPPAGFTALFNGKDLAGRRLLLFANPLSQKDRSHQTIRVSDDDGATWPEERRILLDEGRGRGYPSLARVAADRVGIVYEGSRADVVFQVVPVSDLQGAAP